MKQAQLTTGIAYHFGLGTTNGAHLDQTILGGKGHGLIEMASVDGTPVPPGIVIPTTECMPYLKHKSLDPTLIDEIKEYVDSIGTRLGRTFGSETNPLLLSCRSGAAVSMPGMLKTILNIGTSRATIPGLIEMFNERLAWDNYRRLIDMWGETVVGIDHEHFENVFIQYKADNNINDDVHMSAEDMEKLCSLYEQVFEVHAGYTFPQDVWEQLLPAVEAVFKSWYGKKAVEYRKIEKLTDLHGTAVIIMAMVFGNFNDQSGTGVLFTRRPDNGLDELYGEILFNAQGEDIVAGIRTPEPISKLKEILPHVYEQLFAIVKRLEKDRKDIQDIEFTIEDGNLYMLQTRNGKRNGIAAFKIAYDMVQEGIVTERYAVERLVKPEHVQQMLLPRFDEETIDAYRKEKRVIAKGLPASPGAAVGQVVFDKETAVAWSEAGKNVILVRRETSPEDIQGMHVAKAVLTVIGGLSSHAGVVLRGWGKPGIVGAGSISINHEAHEFTVGEHTVKEGDWISLNSTTGEVVLGQWTTSEAEETEEFKAVMEWAKRIKRMGVRANAETVADAARARYFGAEGISLFRTEHMFYGEDGANSLYLMKKMILATSGEQKAEMLALLQPEFAKSFFGTLREMDGLPVTVRLLDPPMHEFVHFGAPANEKAAEAQREMKLGLCSDLGITMHELDHRIESLHEVNPGSGLRGSRLGVIFPDVTRIQVHALCEAIMDLRSKGHSPFVEIEVPFVFNTKEYENQLHIISDITTQYGLYPVEDYLVGPMIECTAACLDGANLARESQFASFGSNDLTSSVMNISRDDASRFIPYYVEYKLLPEDPFQTINPIVGEVMLMAVERLRSEKGKSIKVGVCGEQGGDPLSIREFERMGLDYIGCSPFRIPVAILAAAQATMLVEKETMAAQQN